MSGELRALTEETYQRVMDTLRRVGALPPRQDIPVRGQSHADDLGEWVQVTSLTPTSGFYPAAVATYSVTGGTWSTGSSVWFLPANGETPTLNARYHARVVGVNASGVAVYADNLSSSSGSGVNVTDGTHTVTGSTTIDFSGATVSGSGGSATVTINNPSPIAARTILQSGTNWTLGNSGSDTYSFDTGSFLGAGSNAHFTIPSTGYYRIDLYAYWSTVSGSNGIILNININGSGGVGVGQRSFPNSILAAESGLLASTTLHLSASDQVSFSYTFGSGTSATQIYAYATIVQLH